MRFQASRCPRFSLDDTPAGGSPLKRQEATVQLLQAGSVPDADNSCSGKPLEQQGQQSEFAVNVERRGRFAHDDDVRFFNE
jgi:hypothetical protein